VTALGRSSVRHTITLPGSREGVELSWHALTHTGHRRAGNEDSYLADVPLFAVADGMGGHSHGDRASDAVVRRLQAAVDGDFVESAAIIEALNRATWDIHQLDDASQGIGTTVTGVALSLSAGQAQFTVFNVGDSRVYCFADGMLKQITTDHSVVQEMIERGQLTVDEAESHPDANVITRAVGFSVEPDVDLQTLPLTSGMRILVCSDGLTKEVPFDRIAQHLGAQLSARETANSLVDAALTQGGRDNITVIVVDVVRALDH
jgi:protein phosphatase